MRGTLRVLQLLALVVWVGGLIFFAFALAPTAFGVLPNTHEAGLIVGASLRKLHGMGLVAGAVFLLAALAGTKRGRWWVGAALVAGMMVLTAGSQWEILPRMEVDRAAAGGDVASADLVNPARVDFDRLHRLSERVEGGVLLLGLAVVVVLGLERDERRT